MDRNRVLPIKKWQEEFMRAAIEKADSRVVSLDCLVSEAMEHVALVAREHGMDEAKAVKELKHGLEKYMDDVNQPAEYNETLRQIMDEIDKGL